MAISIIKLFLNTFSEICTIYPFNYFVGGIIIALMGGILHKLTQ